MIVSIYSRRRFVAGWRGICKRGIWYRVEDIVGRGFQVRDANRNIHTILVTWQVNDSSIQAGVETVLCSAMSGKINSATEGYKNP